MITKRQSKIIVVLLWLVVGVLLLVSIAGILRYCYLSQSAEVWLDDAAEYAMQATSDYLLNEEISMGDPPAHGYCDYESRFISSCSYSGSGTKVMYEFVIYNVSTIVGGVYDSAYYAVTVKCTGQKEFSLISVKRMEGAETV